MVEDGVAGGEMSAAGDELRAAQERALAALRARWAEEPPEREEVLAYSIGFECAPSTFDRILEFVRQQPVRNRAYRFYPLARTGAQADGRDDG